MSEIVERLQERAIIEMMLERDELRSRLAEAGALLREVSHDGQDIGGNIELFDRIDAFLAREQP